MNIFEDLIDELKEENLIEQTVIETNTTDGDFNTFSGNTVKNEAKKPDEPVVELKEAEQESPEKAEPIAADGFAAQTPADEEIVQNNPVDEAEFYRRRAMEEVTFLQTVESVFGGIEREQVKIVPNPYDDLEVKKVLHSFLQISPSAQQEHSDAQFQLLQETESWHSSLAMRDERIMTAHLRRFCETSRPPLGVPALIALARFYRNSPYSELVRSKFDLVVTRLFSKEIGDSRREMVFSREELAAHIRDLYADWSSVPMYSTEDDDEQILQTVRQFEEFIREADGAQTFDELINNNFYNRLRLFKESTNEDFYAPAVTAAGIETNIRVGNRYVELLNREKETSSNAAIEDRYGLAHDQSIAEATGKTFSLIELLNQKKPIAAPLVEEKPLVVRQPEPVKEAAVETKIAAKSGGRLVKLLVVAAILATIVFAVYFMTRSDAVEMDAATAGIPRMNLENSMLKEYLQEARVSEETLKGVVTKSWNELPEDKKREVLKQTLVLGAEKNFKKVEFVDEDGKTIGSAEGANVFIF